MAAGDGRSYTSFTARLAFMVSRFGGQYIAMVDGRVVAMAEMRCRSMTELGAYIRRVEFSWDKFQLGRRWSYS